MLSFLLLLSSIWAHKGFQEVFHFTRGHISSCLMYQNIMNSSKHFLCDSGTRVYAILQISDHLDEASCVTFLSWCFLWHSQHAGERVKLVGLQQIPPQSSIRHLLIHSNWNITTQHKSGLIFCYHAQKNVIQLKSNMRQQVNLVQHCWSHLESRCFFFQPVLFFYPE